MQNGGTLLLYFLISLVTALMVHMASRAERKYSMIMTILAILPAALLAGLRKGIGTDYYYTYFPYFLHLKNGTWFWDVTIEPGYTWLNQLIIWLAGDVHWVLLVMALVTLLCIVKTLFDFKQEVNVGFAMFVFMLQYYFVSYNWMRQCCAASISMCALVFVQKKNWKKVLIIVVTAMLIHKTSIITIGMYVLIRIFQAERNKFTMLMVYISVFSLLFSTEVIYAFLSNKGFQYAYYLKPSSMRVANGVVVRRGIVVLCVLSQWKALKKEPFMKSLFHLFCIGAIMELMTYIVASQIGRGSLYMRLPSCLMIGYLCGRYFKGSKMIVDLRALPMYAMILFTVFEWYYELFLKGYHEVVPYTWIF